MLTGVHNRELRALSSAIRGQHSVAVEAVPLQPEALRVSILSESVLIPTRPMHNTHDYETKECCSI